MRTVLTLIPVPLGRKKDPFCEYIRKPITQKAKRIPNTDLVATVLITILGALKGLLSGLEVQFLIG